MLVPRHWAEARLQHREGRRTVTVRRFGWSDESEALAQAHADARAREALDRILAGEALPRNERRVGYNGADGMPIREEIVDRQGDAVITRNGYGALCLNTPDLLFADIDFAQRPSSGRAVLVSMIVTGILVVVGLHAGLGRGWPASLAAAFFASLAIGIPMPGLLHRWGVAVRGGAERLARKRIDAFLAARPDWRVRLYRTPAGLRLMAVHRPFDPREPEVPAAFDALGVDPTFARMCHNQRCFRARLTAKPWRIGLSRLRPPSSAAWQPAHATLPARQAWIEAYTREAAAYAACRYLDTLGSGAEAPELVQQREYHDTVCAADRDLPLA